MKAKKQINYADYIRVIAMFFILLCHIVQENSNVYIQMSAQIFNIGVPMFFILSGFLFGISTKNITKWKEWYKKRIKRIFIPYWFFVIILGIIYIIQRKGIFNLNWLLLVFGLQGSNVGILGAGQTWFITSIIICYLCTPLIRKIANNEYANVIMAMLYVIFPCILSLFKPAWPSTLLCPITSYSIAYLIGKNINKIDFKMNYAFIAILILGTAFGIRFISRIMFDGTFLYERVIVQYTSSIGAFCICYIVSAK